MSKMIYCIIETIIILLAFLMFAYVLYLNGTIVYLDTKSLIEYTTPATIETTFPLNEWKSDPTHK